MKLKLTYIYHSGFAIQAPGVTILIDYIDRRHPIATPMDEN